MTEASISPLIKKILENAEGIKPTESGLHKPDHGGYTNEESPCVSGNPGGNAMGGDRGNKPEGLQR